MAEPDPSRPPPPDAGVMSPHLLRALRLLPLLALLAFVAIAILVHWLRDDLSLMNDHMSMYLFGPWGHLLQLAYCLLAAAMVLLCLGIRMTFAPPARNRVPMLLVGLAATALCVTAFAWMDIGRPMMTVEGIAHGISAQATFLCATSALLLLAWRMRADAWWRRQVRWILPWATTCFVLVWMLALTQGIPRGLAQKLVILVVLGLLLMLSLCLRRRLGTMLVQDS